MNWSTPVQIPQGTNRIDYHSKTVVLGSCFATHLGFKLAYFQFQALTNPFGVIFHPGPLEKLVQRALQKRPFVTDELFENQSLWRSFQVHSTLGRPNLEQALDLLNNRLKQFDSELRAASHIIITLGTAFGYIHKSTGALVANCHTVGSVAFEKVLSNPHEIETQIRDLIHAIQQVNPKIQVILTVSPVRHLKDGLDYGSASGSTVRPCSVFSVLRNTIGRIARLPVL
jgi:hypothetical protein